MILTSEQLDPLDWPTAQEVVEGIRTQTCPWCGSGPWRALGSHIHQKHGIYAGQVKTYIGLPLRHMPICSAEHSRAQANRSQIAVLIEMSKSGESARRKRLAIMARARKQLQRDREARKSAIRQAVDGGETDAQIAVALGISRRAAGEARRALGLKRNPAPSKVPESEYATVVARRSAGETFSEIAKSYGVKGSHIEYIWYRKAVAS